MDRMGTMKTLLVVLAALAASAPAVCAAPPGPIVRVAAGRVQGSWVDAVRVFRAIPYAQPPVGPLRWRAPRPAAPWTGVRAATADGPACEQAVSPGRYNLGGYRGPVSEDCLTLDVFAPARAARAPVMVWIYGGGDVAGADSISPNDGRFFARDGVVLVAMNYRLGALGFFAHPALTRAARAGAPLANYGIMDQIAALKWVRRNIAAFGGDPRNVTILGESAGGEDVLTLMATPAARGLFEKASVESGGGWGRPTSLAKAEAAGAALAGCLGLGADATAAQLRALPAGALIGAGGRFGPVVDGRLIDETPAQAFARGDEAPVPLIIGANTWEASLLPPAADAAYLATTSPKLRAAYAAESGNPGKLAQAMFTDAVMGAPARWFAARARGPAWLYEFAYVRASKRGRIPGANHTSENPYVFDTQTIIPGYSRQIVAQDRAVAAFMHSCWVAFAKTGAPDCRAQGRTWPRYDPKTDELMWFGASPRIVQHYRKAQLDAQEAARR